ncbi:hypothetical protein CSKR_104666 [Clonorchis sinensis]|uniref:Uncharacterized protein n=1 Tax=Clonorchis sinensis TaxID=79923 RepID=A0A419PLX2_CLOSI|nr:hypothetical protein CSKR_104666 [Clonorchis sinensis]
MVLHRVSAKTFGRHNSLLLRFRLVQYPVNSTSAQSSTKTVLTPAIRCCYGQESYSTRDWLEDLDTERSSIQARSDWPKMWAQQPIVTQYPPKAALRSRVQKTSIFLECCHSVHMCLTWLWGEPESVKQRRVSTLGYLIPKRRMSNKLTCMIRIRNQSYFTFEHDKSPAIELTSKCRSEFHSTTLTRHLLYAEKQHRLTGETKKAFAAELFIRETPTQQLQTIGQGSKTLICIFFTKLNIHLLLERGFLNFPSYSLTVAPMQANATKRLRKFRNRSHFSRDAKRIYEKTCYSHTSSEYPPLHQ